jgi:hypothetical protein
MNRREALRLLAAGVAVPLAPRGVMAILREARAAVGEKNDLRTLTPHQCVTVRAMAEMIIPRTDTPGAADVGACEFVDLMLTEWYEPAEKERFLQGMADLDARSLALFNANFVECPADRQAVLLEELGEGMVAEHDLKEGQTGSSEEGESFYPMLRRLVLTVYYTSEEGATDELHFEIIPGRYDGCAPTQSEKEGVERK